MTRLASALALEARDCVKKDVDDISLASIQACVLTGNMCGIEGNNQAEALYFGWLVYMSM